jgi:hypothetical protein
MHLLVRTLMAASLIAADAAHAASLTATQARREAEKEQVTSYDARIKDILDRDERSWKRISASICVGCGSPPPPLEIVHATPSYPRAQRAVATSKPATVTTASTADIPPASAQSAALREYEGARIRVVHSKPNRVRSAAKARRYARLRMIRHQRRLALLRAQRRHAVPAAQAQHTASRVRMASLEGVLGRETGYPGGERRPTPLPPQRPDTLCADDRGLVKAGFRPSSVCVSPR